MAEEKRTLVLGASTNPSRYSFLALKKLQAHGHSVFAIGRRKGKVGDINIETDHIELQNIDTITLYLNPENQEPYIDYILSLKPRRIIFNPGTENNKLVQSARSLGIMPVMGCTLVMLSVGTY